MSGLPPIQGHAVERAALARAARNGALPGSLLFHGPPGIGRQRMGLWLGQLLLCQEPSGDEPCGECRDCRLVQRLEHPDLHWFFPLVRPRGVSGDRLGDALEDARAEELAARRAEPLRPATPGEPVGHFLAQVQTLRRFAASRPSMGRRRIFLLGEAELLVPQESSPEAANAFLKVLEEPPDETTFILTAGDPEALLPTLRSRLLGVRLRPLEHEAVAAFLVEQRGAEPDQAARAARLSEGSIGRALAFLPGDDGAAGPLEELRARARELLAAAADGRAERRLAAAHAAGVSGARGAFTDTLDLLVLWLRDLAASAAGAEELVINHDALDWLRGTARGLPSAAAGAPGAIAAVQEARALAHGNVNPQLVLARLLRDIGQALRATP